MDNWKNLKNSSQITNKDKESTLINDESTNKEIVKTIIDNIEEMIFYKDKNRRYIGCNDEYREFFKSKGIDNIFGKRYEDLSPYRDSADKFKKSDVYVMENKESIYEEEIYEGATYQIKKFPILDKNDDVTGVVGIIKNLRKNKVDKKLLKTFYNKDSLTQVYSRTYFDEKLNEYIKKDSFPIGIILGDINGLKIVNDTIGHLEGDKVLKKMALIMKEVCKDKGSVFRWGGDQFIILVPNSSEKECLHIMNQIDDECIKTNFGTINISLCQGKCILEKNGSVDKAIGCAENQVYKQKILSGSAVRSSILDNLKSNLQNKNVETELHTDRVSEYCVEMAKSLNLGDDMIEKAHMIGKLHDIGKISIPDQIILKPGKLTDEEYEVMKTHSQKGYRLACLIPEISTISNEILTHHERWDGKGYPLGLKEDEIPILSRIVCIADSFDAMTEDRCYSKGRSRQKAIEELRRCSGSQFDPNLVEIFINMVDKEEEFKGRIN